MPFAKGQSGNPGGRPGVTVNGVNIAELARSYAPSAIKKLAKLIENDETPPGACVAAITAMLDRGFGKPLQQTEISGRDGKDFMPPADPKALRREFLETMAELKTLGYDPTKE